MPLSHDVLKNWAAGAKAPQEGDMPDEDSEEIPQEGESERNVLWAGEGSGDVSPEDAEELLSWLEENEPEIHDAIMQLAQAVAEGDEVALEHAQTSLKTATQYLNPEYEPLTDDQKKDASSNIAKHMREKGHPDAASPEAKQAIAIGLSEARSGKAEESEEPDSEEPSEPEAEEAPKPPKMKGLKK